MTRTSRLRKRTNKEKSAQKAKKPLFLADSTIKTTDFVDTDTKNYYSDESSDNSRQNGSFYVENRESDVISHVSTDSIEQVRNLVRA